LLTAAAVTTGVWLDQENAKCTGIVPDGTHIALIFFIVMASLSWVIYTFI